MTGKEFKIKRVTLDMTQAELATELGLQANTVSRYETGDLSIPRTVELAMETLERRMQEQQKEFLEDMNAVYEGVKIRDVFPSNEDDPKK